MNYRKKLNQLILDNAQMLEEDVWDYLKYHFYKEPQMNEVERIENDILCRETYRNNVKTRMSLLSEIHGYTFKFSIENIKPEDILSINDFARYTQLMEISPYDNCIATSELKNRLRIGIAYNNKPFIDYYVKKFHEYILDSWQRHLRLDNYIYFLIDTNVETIKIQSHPSLYTPYTNNETNYYSFGVKEDLELDISNFQINMRHEHFEKVKYSMPVREYFSKIKLNFKLIDKLPEKNTKEKLKKI